MSSLRTKSLKIWEKCEVKQKMNVRTKCEALRRYYCQVARVKGLLAQLTFNSFSKKRKDMHHVLSIFLLVYCRGSHSGA